MEKEEYLYEKNIANIRMFFCTKEYQELRQSQSIDLIKQKIKLIYKDPDSYDSLLYQSVKEKYQLPYEVRNCLFFDARICLSLDGIMGWKAIVDTYVKNGIPLEKFLDVYQVIRNPKNAGHLIWPCHKVPTLNTERYQAFNDRVDYVLFDLRNFYDLGFDRENLKLKNVYFHYDKEATTYDWLSSFSNFNDFIECMHLERWCKKIDGQYEVLDVAKNDGSIISQYLGESKESYPITIEYITHVMEIISRD